MSMSAPAARTERSVPGGLSALIIAKDEERDLPGCLESLEGLADEIVVVVDSASRDNTEDIARRAGAKVLLRAFDHYAGQRQQALESCTKHWVLWIDCDERITPELKSAILLELRAPRVHVYTLRFEIQFLGKVLRWGGLGRETHERLFTREGTRFTGGLVHEGIARRARGPRRILSAGAVRHSPYRDLGDYLSKLDRYTSLAARKKYESGRRFHGWHHFILPWEFFSRAVLKLGFLDGPQGLVWAGLSAFHSWLKYVKLKRLCDEEGVAS